VEALRTSILLAELGGTHSPLINRVSWLVVMGGTLLAGTAAIGRARRLNAATRTFGMML
jgi:hypothetical protein